MIGFSFPLEKGVANYKIEIAVGNYYSQDSFNKNIIKTTNCKKNKVIIEVPSFATHYTWRTVYTNSDNNLIKTGFHHFSTFTIADTNKIRLRITKSAEKYKDAYVFSDAAKAMFNMAGQPVWYLPELYSNYNDPVRDLKLSCKATITFLLGNAAYEINYDGDILWTGPKGHKQCKDTIEGYHHELTRLNNGHYMVLDQGPFAVNNLIVLSPNLKIRSEDSAKAMGVLGAKSLNLKPDFSIIEEYDEKGNVVWSWKSSDHISENDLTNISLLGPGMGPHENAFYFDERKHNIYLSCKNIDRILKISYPKGNIVRDYGRINLSEKTRGSHLFCGQHSCKLSKEGFLYLYDNGCDRTGLPKILEMKEPVSDKDTLKTIWEFPCPVELPKDILKTPVVISGGNVIEMPDNSLFVSTDREFGTIFIVSMNKNILWGSVIEKWHSIGNNWLPLPQYRASIIPDSQKLEELIWHISLK
ncbi:MAG TPA: aryl-sulfate sulfotransferase [Chitinophagaceae bacterium]|nr:aryl-sulfate sulfotransferase [Chitinophagaceae bacterium]